MTQVTGGTIHYERRVKTGEFEHKFLGVTMTFSVPDGETGYDPFVDEVARSAVSRVHQLLGIAGAPAGRVAVAVAPPATGAKEAYAAKPEVPKKPGRPPNVAAQPAAASSPAAPDPLAMPASDARAAAMVVATEKGNAQSAADITEFTGTAPAVTDQELNSQMTIVNGRIKNPIAIRALIGKFAGAGKHAHDIKPEQRRQFLEELGKL